MPRVQATEKVTNNRLFSLRERILKGEMSEARAELKVIQESFQGTRQAFSEKLQRLADLSLRPVLSNGQPMGTVGYHMLCEFQATQVPMELWIPRILLALSRHQNTKACVQILEWLLDSPIEKK